MKDKQRIHKEWFGFGRDKKVTSLLFVVWTYWTIFGEQNNAIPRNMHVPEMSESNKETSNQNIQPNGRRLGVDTKC